MHEKAVNDAVAYIRSLAQLRGRNLEFAEHAVREARSLAATDALAAGVIDFIASDIDDLLKKIDGRRVKLAAGELQIDVAGAVVESMVPDWRSRVLGVLSNPTIAVALMMMGIYGLFVEFTNPGFGLPGTAGAICLLLAMYAFHMLSVNWTGVALLLLGSALMDAGFGVPLPLLVALALATALVILVIGGLVLKARKRPVVSGRESLLGTKGTVLAVDGGETWAQVEGERWRVRASDALAPGDRVRVTAVDGLTLVVGKES
jgi:membrane-bound serine protease (ClpP class)